ncbi:SGNH/GDSL hydrolase family protein [Nostoc sp. FACHB-152]|uniref:SGNH/GDSL hydrolase family protein n=1 Tax=unclassified Nostoc TaxID=2593658 RepID=UPI00168676EB|nr:MULTISPECIES: SGNH/GDSL hydrolase family protein [unclassified Nostoc]MBD2451511.1 SGNH/GDSL hydrolase family protein [Nostoc sp. FACHB-152]MBD2468625.1 SGNH/GDSL hydrolase family protein [Nostoc sp. FACHB-145]
MKILFLIILVLVGLLTALEIGLRSLFGFGKPLIYLGDSQIGYLLAPNQHTRRYGNKIEINQFSMRSSPIEKIPAPATLRVLLLGDSIANGGWWTDQKNTISNLMLDSLKSAIADKYQQVEVLNASANSWGPRNELAYLQRFGNFSAQVVVLLINTDDLFATNPTSVQVGRDRNYPDSKPALALIEVWQRYLTKQQPIPELQAIQKEGGDRVGVNLEAIGKIQALANQHNSKFLLAMTPLLREIGKPVPLDYEIKARQRLSDFTKVQQIPYIDFLPLFNASPNPKALYHDTIHMNLQGNQFVSGVIERSLLEILSLN